MPGEKPTGTPTEWAGIGSPASGSEVDAPRSVVTFVAEDRLRTGLQELRGGCKPTRAHQQALAELPLRVVPADDGCYEVVDGFKRLARWRAAGCTQVPVILERPGAKSEQMAMLLSANSPPRTLSPMDEARVVHALRHQQGLGPKTIASVCGRKPGWVTCRLTLADRLCEPVARRVDDGSVGITLAHALCALHPDEQEAVCAAVQTHRLKGGEALALVAAVRVAEGPEQRKRLLRSPLGVVRPEPQAVPHGALCERLQQQLTKAREAIETLAAFELPNDGLTAAERRRLQAQHRSVLHQLFTTGQALAVEHLCLFSNKEDMEGVRT